MYGNLPDKNLAIFHRFYPCYTSSSVHPTEYIHVICLSPQAIVIHSTYKIPQCVHSYHVAMYFLHISDAILLSDKWL